MNYREEEILEKTKTILKDLEGNNYREENIKKIIFQQDEVMARGKDIDKEHPSWTVVLNEPLLDSSVFLVISDDTGEPIYIQNKHITSEIGKNEEGKYILL